MSLVKKIKNNSCCVLSFLISILFVVIGFAIAGVYPFGDLSMAVSDLRVQYLDLTIAVAEKIKNGESIFLTMATGGGINLYAWAAYILFNPLNVLFLIFDSAYVQEIYLFIYIVKLGFAGLCASLYMKKSKLLKVEGILNVAFSLLYALCMFNVKASINIMWIDNVALLPLCFLGVERLVDKRRIDLFVPVYFACVMTNYYLSYITGVFCFIYFVYYIVLTKNLRLDKGVAIKPLLLLVLSAGLVLGLSSIMLLPTYSAINSGYTEMFDSAEGWVNWELSEIFQGLLFFVNANSTRTLLLMSYSGIIPLFLVVMLFISKGVALKEKIISLILIVFLIMGLWFKPLYLALHFFRHPASFYGRFAYAMTLFLIIFSLRCVINIKHINNRVYIIPFILFVLGVNSALSAESTFRYIANAGIVLVAVIAYTVITALFVNGERPVIFKRVISVCTLLEAFVLIVVGINVMKVNDGYQLRSKYTDFLNKNKALLQEINAVEDNTDFYRATNIHHESVLSPLSVGYNDVGVFSSLANQNVTYFMNQLGMCSTSGNKYVDNSNNTLPVDSLLNIKYVMATNQDLKRVDNNGREVYLTYGYRLNSPKYEEIIDGENGAVFKNLTAFPLMFKADEGVINSSDSFVSREATYNGAFNNQEVFFNALFDNEYEWYPRYKFNAPEITNAEAVEDNSGAVTLKLTNISEKFDVANTNDELGKIKYTFTVEEPGQYYTNLYIKHNESDFVDTQFVPIFNNLGSKIHYLNDSAIIDLGYFEKGDEIWIEIQTRRELTFYHPSLVRLNMAAFEETAQTAQNNGLIDIHQVGSDILAKSDFDEESFVFTTIAYDEGFDVYIDDVKTEKVKVCGGLLGYYVPAGQHNITIKYVSPGFYEGRNVSLIFLVLTALALFMNRKAKPYVAPVAEAENEAVLEETETEVIHITDVNEEQEAYDEEQ